MKTAFKLSSGSVESLKWLALLAMVVDHVNAVFFGRELGALADVVGRVAFPLFALVIGYNLARPGADHERLLVRLALFGCVAFVPHALLFGTVGGWWPGNVLFTFAVAVAVLVHLDRGHPWMALALFVLGGALVEYWWPGVALVVTTCALVREPSWRRAAGVGSALCFLCVVNGNAWAWLALPLVALLGCIAPAVPRLRWAFWLAYPAHLAMFAIVASTV